MNKTGFSLLEIAIVVLITFLLLHAVFNLLSLSFSRFSHQEEAVLCAGEAGLISAQLRQDLEDCLLASGTDVLMALTSQISCADLDLRFPGRSGEVSYTFQPAEKKVIRQGAGKTHHLGSGFLSEFAVVLQVLFADGTLRSFPAQVGDDSAPPEGTVAPWRAWLSCRFTLAGNPDKKPQVVQNYAFKVFPIRVNRQIQSIWNSQVSP